MANISKELMVELEERMKGITDAYVTTMAYAMDMVYPDGASDDEYMDVYVEFAAIFSKKLAKSVDDLTNGKLEGPLS